MASETPQEQSLDTVGETALTAHDETASTEVCETTSTAADERNLTAVDVLKNSKDVAGSALARLEELHYLCIDSKLFSEDVIVEVDSCAVDFRELALNTVTVAEMVSNQWLDSIILFYTHISTLEITSIHKNLKTLGGQAKQLGQIFEVISAWSRDLSGRLTNMFRDVQHEIKGCQEKFEHELEEAMKEVKKAEDKFNEAQKAYEEATRKQDNWGSVQLYCPWSIFTAIVLFFKYEKEASEAASQKDEAQNELDEKNRELNEATSKKEKAEKVSVEAAKLIGNLKGVEKLYGAIGTFWKLESDKFITQGQKMITNESTISEKKYFVDVISKHDIESWEESKSEFDSYVDTMSVVSNQYVFVTTAKPLPLQEIALDQLSFKMKIPATVDVKASIGASSTADIL